MQKNEHHYFACSNTAQGFVNHFSSVLQDSERIFILKGGPGCGKSTLMKKIGTHFATLGERVDYIHCSSDSDSLDGVILCERRVAIADGTSPHVLEPTAPGAREEYCNLGIGWNREKLIPYREEILDLYAQISKEYREIYQILARAKEVHDRWEKVYLDDLDFEKLTETAESLKTEILDGMFPNPKKGKRSERFFGALTPNGSVNYIENLTCECQRRYLICGRPGTGKSTLMKRIAEAAEVCGMNTEVYHCGFDAQSVDMVVLRQIGVCLVDATAPHEVYPSRDGDILVDLYATAVKEGTDETHREILSLVKEEYSREIGEVRSHLTRVHCLHDALEEYYIHAMDFRYTDEVATDMIREIELYHPAF